MAREKSNASNYDVAGRTISRLHKSLLYYSGQLDRTYKNAVAAGEPTWRILRYEKITAPEDHMFPIALNQFVRPKTFEMHLKYLKKNCNVISIDKLVELLETNQEIPNKTVVITFDHGWIDNFFFAAPLLAQYQLPASVFVCTKYIGTAQPYWEDQVKICILSLYDHSVFLSDIPIMTDIFAGARLKKEDLKDEGTTTNYISLLLEYLKGRTEEERQNVFAAISKVLEEKLKGFPMELSFIGWPAAKQMNAAGISFGSQGNSHRVFSELSAEDVREEIRQSHSILNENGLTPANAFCLPEGAITKDARRVIKEEGINYALAIGAFPLPKHPIKDQATILGRIPIYESVAFCTEFFAYRIWTSN